MDLRTSVIIIDDEIVRGELCKRVLSRENRMSPHNFEAYHYTDTQLGYGALMEIINANGFAVLLTDNDVEKGNAGLDLIKKIREERIRIPIVQMSGLGIEHESITCGADYFVMKSAGLDSLLNAVRNALNIYAMRNIIEGLCPPFRGIPLDYTTRDRFDIVCYNLNQFEKQGLVVVNNGKLSVLKEKISQFEDGVDVAINLTNGASGLEGIAGQLAEPVPDGVVKIAYREGVARRVI